MSTPAITSLSKKHGPIPCFFDTRSIGELYANCPFIKVLDNRPNNDPIFTSVPCRRRRKLESDAECLFRFYGDGASMPSSYVDRNVTKRIDKGNDIAIALFHGCLGDYWKQKKRLPSKTLQNMVDIVKSHEYIPVILGNKRDWKDYWKSIGLSGARNFVNKLDLRDSVSILSQCDAFISNDTGLYHVAAALKVPGLVLWNQTNIHKNKAPWNGITHCRSKVANRKVYKTAIRKFVRSL